jgi:RNA polymerase sigma-70 factor (ECF subfamily)
MARDVTELLRSFRKGNPEAGAKLIPLVYEELRRMARRYMRQEPPDHTLQATALIHEAYLRLVEQKETNWQSRAHFFAVAAQLMRRILVDHARACETTKRGGAAERVPLEEESLAWSPEKSSELIALDESLNRLAQLSPRQSQIVEMRFFGGLTVEETAEVLQITPRTVNRDWSVARAWLYREIRKTRPETGTAGSDHS